MILEEHQKNGAKVKSEEMGTLKFEGDSNGAVSKVVLKDSYELPADMVIVCAGSIPDNQLAKDAGLQIDNNGFIKTNPFMQTSDSDIFAAGDNASFPLFLNG